jgi:hypothetical protein
VKAQVMRAILAAAVVACTACGDDAAPTDAGADAGPVPIDGGGTGGIAFDVLRVLLDGTTEPASGALAYLVEGSGATRESTLGADGRVTFDGIDFDLGAATVTIWEEGHVLTAIANIGASGVEGPAYLLPIVPAPSLVMLGGTVAGMMDPAMHTVVVSSTTGGFYNGDPTYTMDVPAGEAGTLVAFEFSAVDVPRGFEATFHQATTAAFAAPAADATTDLDFAMSAMMSTVSGSLPTPSSLRRASALNTGEIVVRVSGFDVAGAFLGSQTRLAESGARVEYDLTFAQLDTVVTEPYTAFVVSDSPEQSVVFEAGWPAGGAAEITFLDPPAVLEPDFRVDQPWSEPVRWESANLDTHPSVIQVVDEETQRLHALTLVEPGTGVARLPPLPPGVTVADVMRGSTPEARIAVCDRAGARVEWTCSRFASSRTFGVTP